MINCETDFLSTGKQSQNCLTEKKKKHEFFSTKTVKAIHSFTYQECVILKGVVQVGNPPTIAKDQNISFFFETGRLQDKRKHQEMITKTAQHVLQSNIWIQILKQTWN